MALLFGEVVISCTVEGFGLGLRDVGSIEVRRRSLHQVAFATLYRAAWLKLGVKDHCEELIKLSSAEAEELSFASLKLFDAAAEIGFGEMRLELLRAVVVMDARGEPQAEEIFLHATEVHTRTITFVAEVDALEERTQEQAIAPILVEGNIAASKGSFT